MAVIRIRRSGRQNRRRPKHFRHVLGTEEGHLFYHDLGLEIFLNEISDLSKAEYVRRIFKDYRKEEISEAVGLLGCIL